MEPEYYVCTGCALLCDDIELKVEDNVVTGVNNACSKGVARMKGSADLAECLVEGEVAQINEGIDAAISILGKSRNPLIFGLGNSTLEAQERAIGIAKKLNGYIDDTSSFCQGPLIEAILDEKVRTCTLDEVRDRADVVVYWGADPASSHPRHLSMYSYFPRGKERQRGWEEDRTAVCIDVRCSDTGIVCGNGFYQIPPQKDAELIKALISALSGKVPKVPFMGPKEVLKLANIMKKAKFGVICVGLGLLYSLEELDVLFELMDKLNEVSDFHIIPMVGQYNMRGFDQTLHEQTGYINRVHFDASGIEHGPGCSAVELLNAGSVDAALVIGSDPLSSLPGAIAAHLKKIPVITIDPSVTLTSKIAKVCLPCARGGVESGGRAVRMDGVEVELRPACSVAALSDVEILEMILEGL